MKTNPNESVNGNIENLMVDNDGNLKEIRGEGLTKREHFAGLAMQGLCSSHHEEHWGNFEIDKGRSISCAGVAVTLADALIKELNKVVDDDRT